MRKSIALVAVIAALPLVLAAPAAAQEAELTAEQVQFNLDVIYFMLAAGLVFWMQAGFAILEAGMTA